MTDLPELLSRVEAATGPDRELDATIHVALCQPVCRPDDCNRYRLPHISMDEMDMCAPGTYWLVERSGRSLHTSPTYTASLDAAVALCERVLPECEWDVTGPKLIMDGDGRRNCDASISVNTVYLRRSWRSGEREKRGDKSFHTSPSVREFIEAGAEAATPALALLAAMLKALIANAALEAERSTRASTAAR